MEAPRPRRLHVCDVKPLVRMRKPPGSVGKIDEADLLAPQRVMAGGERLLGAMSDLVRRGRVRGLGVTLVTQRPATLNKDILTQAEVLIALRMTAPATYRPSTNGCGCTPTKTRRRR